MLSCVFLVVTKKFPSRNYDVQCRFVPLMSLQVVASFSSSNEIIRTKQQEVLEQSINLPNG